METANSCELSLAESMSISFRSAEGNAGPLGYVDNS
jgi:hypothetical protein